MTLQVVDELGQGVPDVELLLAGDTDVDPLSTLTGEDGRGVLQVMSDAYSVGVERLPVPYLPVLSTQLDVVADTTYQVVLRLGARVSGRLLNEAGVPAGGASALEFSLLDAYAANSHRAAVQDESFALGLAPGLYQVSYQGDDLYPTQDLGTLQVEHDTEIDFVLKREPLATTDVAAGDAAHPHTFALSPNYPNPFNAQTVIPYQLARPGDAELAIYTVAGQLVRKLVSSRQQAGEYRISWDGRDDTANPVASGVYLCALESAGKRQMRRLLLLR